MLRPVKLYTGQSTNLEKEMGTSGKTIVYTLAITALSLAACSPTGDGQSAVEPDAAGTACTSESFPELYLAATTTMKPEAWEAARCAMAQIDTAEEGAERHWEFAALRAAGSTRAGYKVALASEPAYSSFGLSQPVVGVLFADMLRDSGALVSRSDGVRLAYEADLMARVADAGINDASTLEEVAASLESIIAFLELPDLVIDPDPAAGGQFIAINAAARFGVLGESVPASTDPVLIRSLETMRVVIEDDAGNILSDAPGSAVMGNPLNSILFLVKQLKKRGESLKPGDLVSLGAYSTPTPIGELSGVTVRYSGIGGQEIAVVARFQ